MTRADEDTIWRPRCAACDALWMNWKMDDACDEHGGVGAIRRAIEEMNRG